MSRPKNFAEALNKFEDQIAIEHDAQIYLDFVNLGLVSLPAEYDIATTEQIIREAENAYCGNFKSNEKFAEGCSESLFDIPDGLEVFIDWGKVWDLKLAYAFVSSDNGNYFRK